MVNPEIKKYVFIKIFLVVCCAFCECWLQSLQDVIKTQYYYTKNANFEFVGKSTKNSCKKGTLLFFAF